MPNFYWHPEPVLKGRNTAGIYVQPARQRSPGIPCERDGEPGWIAAFKGLLQDTPVRPTGQYDWP